MTTIEFFATPGYGDALLANMRYHQAVRVGDRVETSGQGGWDDEMNFPDSLEDEIVRAFDNLERTLAQAGATWRDVISVPLTTSPQRRIPLAINTIGSWCSNFATGWAIGRRSGLRPG